MTLRSKLEEVRKGFKNMGLTLIADEYINNTQKLLCIDKDGYKLICTTVNLNRNTYPSPFTSSNPYVINNINNYLKLSGRNKVVKLLSANYANVNSKLKFICLIDGYEFEATWRSFYYQNNGCPKCGTTLKFTLESIKNDIKNINSHIKIISNEYINSETDLECYCTKHESIFYSKWRELKRGHIGCKKCQHEKFSENTYFRGLHLCGEKSPSWKGGISPLSSHLRDKIKQWKQASLKKYDYKCDITGSNKNLIIHHLHNFSDILRETMEILELPIYQEVNKYTDEELKLIEDTCLELHYKYGLGVCLCEEIHNEFHKIYGKYNNTKEQYEEFKKDELEEMEVIIK
jgi:hypothetical protein